VTPAGTVALPAGAQLDAWARHDWRRGLQIEALADREALVVETENSTYEITVICARTGDVLVRGGRYFADFTPARLAGCSLGGAFLKQGGIYVGFRLELRVARQAIVTSVVRSIGFALQG
jgi:hypothetical protein